MISLDFIKTYDQITKIYSVNLNAFFLFFINFNKS